MKHLVSTCVLLFCSALSHAQSWNFSYTGFYDQEAALFMPELRIAGSFSGVDANRDGVLERGELSSLLIDGKDYVACAADSNAYYYCGADSFRFAHGAGLAFDLGEYGSDPEGLVGGGHLITTGDMRYEYRFDPVSTTERHLRWTDGTLLSVVPAIPEAPAWAMLVVGLFGIKALLTRRPRESGDPY